MSDRELEKLFLKGSRDIDQRQRDRIRQLQGAEKALFEVLVARLTDALNDGNGVVKTGRGSASINQLVDAALKAVDRSHLNDFKKEFVTDLFGIMANSDVYNDELRKIATKVGDKRFKAIQAEVDRVMRASVGIDEKGRSIKGGFIDQIFTSDQVAKSVKEAVNAGVQSGKPMSLLIKELRVITTGTKSVNGALQRYFEPYVFDQYQRLDRATNDSYAGKLGLDTFIYAGGLIETTRVFCEKRNAKVFTVEEANRDWPEDKTLPRTAAEKKSETLVGYNPTLDLGRWNCRHRTRYISRSLAEHLRPDLKKVSGPKESLADILGVTDIVKRKK